MATAYHTCVDQIGDTAGMIWRHLNENGSRTLTQLAKEIDAPRDVVMQAVGWLAREQKLTIEEGSRKKVVSLCS
ncbi:MAG: hypothetical protein DWQ37_08445 [Planctomycetota bacterium]|nr:MAG: hypothetical protein DWQ37_08445 [Planctomycetota bacterium]